MWGSSPPFWDSVKHFWVMWVMFLLVIILAIGIGWFVLWQQTNFLEATHGWCDRAFGVGGWSWNATTACKDTACAEQCVPLNYTRTYG